MAVGRGLRDSLPVLGNELSRELEAGGSLSRILHVYLLALERASGTDMATSILLLEGNGLRHAAAPNLPEAYYNAIDGAEIGPKAGSCGTAAFLNRPIYVEDIANDPLWEDHRHIALPHGLRACWSTPIHGEHGEVIGTFAIYHQTPRTPSREEVQAISTISDHVSRAIRYFGGVQDLGHDAAEDHPGLCTVEDWAQRDARLRSVVSDLQTLAVVIRKSLRHLSADPGASLQRKALQRALEAAEHGIRLARKGLHEQ